MAYIGKTPTVGNFQKCDAISVVNGQAAYTLQVGGSNVSPESPNHILVSLNGVLQAPTDSYTVSGATLTFASNLATGDVIDFVILLGNVLDLGVPSDGTVTNAKLAQDIISGETELAATPAGTDELLISDAGTLKRIDASFFQNTPAWSVHSNADQSLTHQTDTLLAFQTELFDTDSAFTNTASNYKFTVPSGKAGKYFVYAQSVAHNDTNHFVVKLYKNGSEFVAGTYFNYAGDQWPDYSSSSLAAVVDLSESDYLQIYAKHDRGAGSTSDAKHNIGGLKQTRFEGYKLLG